MKNCTIIFSAMLLVFVAMSGQADAAPFSYDFSSMGYTNSENVEGIILDYATFTSETGDLEYLSGYGGGFANGYGATGDIYIAFSTAVDYVSFTAGDGAGDLDAFSVSLFEYGTNSFIGTYNSPRFGGQNEPEWYTLSIYELNIGSIVFDPANSGALPGQLGPPAAGGVIMTAMSYNTSDTAPVPEPSTILLMGAGLLGLLGYNRRRFSKKS